MNIIGSSYWVVGDYEPALEYYQLSAKEAKAVNDMIGLSAAYHNLGEVYKKLGDYKKAINFLTASMEWDSKTGVNYAITLYNIGEAYHELEEFSSAADFYQEALTKALREEDTRTIAYTYIGLGKLRDRSRDYDGALAYFSKAEELWRSRGEIRSLIQTYQYFSDTYVHLGQPQKASDFLMKAIALAGQINATDLQVDNYERQSELAYESGDLRKSILTLRQRNKLRDSIYDENRSQQIARLQVAFENEARAIENQQLRATRALLDAQIRNQRLILVTISGGLVASGFLALIFFRQRKKISEVNELLRDKTDEIHLQKVEIEAQAGELKNLNQQLQDLNRRLEWRIEDRTQQLLYKNQKLAEYAHANAHQLRAPVASILGLIQLLERIDLPVDDKILVEKLQVCATELDRITKLINENLEQEEELIRQMQHG